VRAAATSEGGGPLGPGAEVGPGVRLLLVRHAKAGDRHRAAGPDALRPLSAPGRAQATALVTSLWPLVARSVDVGGRPGDVVARSPWRATRRSRRGAEPARGGQGSEGSRRQPGIDRVRVYSSPARRCVDTVAPIAAALGVAIVDVAALGEGDFDAALDFVRRLLENLRTEGLRDELAVAVACAHGDILTGAVGALLREADVLLPGALPAAKAATWMLEWEPGSGLRHAAYVAPPS
jgi:phosphohistidine phosphatase SixA